MLVDASALPQDYHLFTDICIVGAGPAGLTLARELVGNAYHVCLLEAGPTHFDPTSSGLPDLDPPLDDLTPRSDSRWGGLGGTANLWNTFLRGKPAARFLRLDETDFERRSWLPYSGWPFGLDELTPYYRRAEHLCVSHRREPPTLEASAPKRAMPLDPEVISTTIEPFDRADIFTEQLPSALAGQAGITILTSATVCGIERSETCPAVERLIVCSTPSRRFRVAAKLYILAAGAIENARLLLDANQAQDDRLGNAHDLVGRFFMDHQRLNGGRLVPFHASTFERTALYDLRSYSGHFRQGKLAMAQATLRREHILHNSTVLWPFPSARDDAAVDSLKALLSAVRARRFSAAPVHDLRKVVAGRRYLLEAGLRLMASQRTLSPSIDRGSWSCLPRNAHRFHTFVLIHQFEQAPDPENRVTLSDRRDPFGHPRARVHVRLTDLDLRSYRRGPEILSRHLEERGIGRVVTDPTAPFPDMHQTGGIHHHLGTTRMHADPKQGVVDPNGRVHGVPNLYVSGGSVFPTGGYANPTLTIVALAIRLADHLKAKLAKGAA